MAQTRVYDEELGWLYIDKSPDGTTSVHFAAPPGPPPSSIPDPPAGAPRVPDPSLPPEATPVPVEVDDDYIDPLQLDADVVYDPAEDVDEDTLQLEEQGGQFLAVRDPRVSYWGGVDAHLSRALACQACPNAPHDSRRQPYRACALRCWQSNNAVDIKAPIGYAIRAIRAGVVSNSLGYGLMSRSGGTAGYRLHIEHAGGLRSFYQHMGPRLAARGSRVNQGDVIGHVGDWRPNFGPHCHFAVNLPWSPETFWELVVSRTGRERQAPQPAGDPTAPPPILITGKEKRTMQTAWLNLMRSLGEDRRDAHRRIDLARKATSKAIRS